MLADIKKQEISMPELLQLNLNKIPDNSKLLLLIHYEIPKESDR